MGAASALSASFASIAAAAASLLLGIQSTLPRDASAAKALIESSSRHGEYVDIQAASGQPSVRAFVVYPEVATKAPVVIVLHERFGFGDWTRGVADQLAAEGFIAISPDVRADRTAALAAVRAYGEKLPAATGKTVTLGFGFDGGAAFDLRGEADVDAASRAWTATLASLRQQTR